MNIILCDASGMSRATKITLFVVNIVLPRECHVRKIMSPSVFHVLQDFRVTCQEKRIVPESRCPQSLIIPFISRHLLQPQTNTRPCYNIKTPPHEKFVKTDEASVSGNLQ